MHAWNGKSFVLFNSLFSPRNNIQSERASGKDEAIRPGVGGKGGKGVQDFRFVSIIHLSFVLDIKRASMQSSYTCSSRSARLCYSSNSDSDSDSEDFFFVSFWCVCVR